ncbi:hypothetical protein ACLG6S_11885 [Thermodesulfobacteriota bacterium B35]
MARHLLRSPTLSPMVRAWPRLWYRHATGLRRCGAYLRCSALPESPAATALRRAESGHEILICTDAGETGSRVRAVMPDLVIIEDRFSGNARAGIEAARRLSADPQLCRIPLLMLSDSNREGGLPFGPGAGDISEDFPPVDALLDFPVTSDLLLTTVASLLAPGGRDPRRPCRPVSG